MAIYSYIMFIYVMLMELDTLCYCEHSEMYHNHRSLSLILLFSQTQSLHLLPFQVWVHATPYYKIIILDDKHDLKYKSIIRTIFVMSMIYNLCHIVKNYGIFTVTLKTILYNLNHNFFLNRLT